MNEAVAVQSGDAANFANDGWYANVFTATHAGGESPDLSAGKTYAGIVNVASAEQSSVLRTKPGDPDNSYLVRKVQGTAVISGVPACRRADARGRHATHAGAD
jgi:hypothetical protein